MKELIVKNYKCIKEKKINFSNLTVLAGGNGAGKSTVIQCFLLLAQSFQKKVTTDIPSLLYINDYYCELGNSSRLLNYEAYSDQIEFQFKDSSDCSIKFVYKFNGDTNTLKLQNSEEVIDSLNKSDAINFLTYFDFIGADRYGPKIFHQADKNYSKLKVGKLGEYTALVLDDFKFESLSIGNGNLLDQVEKWMDNIFGHIRLETTAVKKANIAMIDIQNHPKGLYESPVNMPYGVSYVLPIIVSCLVKNIFKVNHIEDHNPDIKETDMIIIENPEAHLHPSAQSKLGYFLAKMSKNVQIIIETHSEHIINGIRLATLENDINNDNVIINFFEANPEDIEPNIREIKIDQFSDLTDWPMGFFDQQEADIREIFEYRRKNRK